MDQDAGISVGDAGDRGRSLFATRLFRRDELLFLIAGPVTTEDDHYNIPISRELCVDPVPLNNPGRYLNHSCEPTAGIQARTMVVAFRDIAPGEEITIDYAMILDDYGDEITEDELICRCGNASCRGRLGAYDRLPAHLRERYRGYISGYLVPEEAGQDGELNLATRADAE